MAVVVSAGGSGRNPIGLRSDAGDRGDIAGRALHPHPAPRPDLGQPVVATKDGPLIVGGLDSSSSSVSGVFELDARSGHLREVGSLIAPLHDAAATVLGDRVLVFGGGTETSTDAVQALAAPGGNVAPGTSAEEVGTLPTVRSDLSAVTLGADAYVLGGDDGNKPIDSVLATANGSSFTQVAKLPVPARYLAVAALGGRIYAFGGLTPGAPPAMRSAK